MRKKMIRGMLQGQGLHVRLTPEQAEAVNNTIKNDEQWQSVADFIRDLVSQATSPTSTTKPLTISKNAFAVLENLGRELGRTPQQIAEDCIYGITELLEGQESPLIIEEIKLRQRYQSSNKKDGKSSKKGSS